MEEDGLGLVEDPSYSRFIVSGKVIPDLGAEIKREVKEGKGRLGLEVDNTGLLAVPVWPAVCSPAALNP